MTPRESMLRMVRAAVGDYRYERTYPCVVDGTHADGTVDVLPDDDVIRGIGLQRVSVTSWDPDSYALTVAGARCLLAFEAGDPAKPRIVAWEYARDSGTVRLGGGEAALARKGDLVDVPISSAIPVTGIVSGSVTTPGSPPVVTDVPPVQFVGEATFAPGQVVRGVIIGGAHKTTA